MNKKIIHALELIDAIDGPLIAQFVIGVVMVILTIIQGFTSDYSLTYLIVGAAIFNVGVSSHSKHSLLSITWGFFAVAILIISTIFQNR